MTPIRLSICRTLCLVAWLFLATVAGAADGERTGEQLLALYDFEERAGHVVHDRSRAEQPLDLHITTPQATRWKDGALVIDGAAAIASAGPAKKIVDAVKQSQAVTIEAWVRPASDAQKGPARIVSLSADPSRRNFTVGQEGNRYDVRFRTAATDENGNPSLPSPDGSLTTELTHVVYRRDAQGRATIHVNGQQQAARQVDGILANWSDEFRLLLANEKTGDRPWRGELHLLGIDHKRLTYFHNGRSFRLTDVAGNVIRPILS